MIIMHDASSLELTHGVLARSILGDITVSFGMLLAVLIVLVNWYGTRHATNRGIPHTQKVKPSGGVDLKMTQLALSKKHKVQPEGVVKRMEPPSVLREFSRALSMKPRKFRFRKFTLSQV